MVRLLHRSWGAVMASVATMALAGTSVAAQEPVRQGWWGAVGAGYGTAQLTCSNCGAVAREGSFSGLLVVGTTLSASFLLGLEVDGWVKNINGDPLRLGGINGLVQWYPSRNMGLFAKGGLGIAYARGDLRFPTSVFVDNAGLGYLLGVGYDISVADGMSITPAVSFYGGTVGDVQSAEGVTFNILQFLIALTLH